MQVPLPRRWPSRGAAEARIRNLCVANAAPSQLSVVFGKVVFGMFRAPLLRIPPCRDVLVHDQPFLPHLHQGTSAAG